MLTLASNNVVRPVNVFQGNSVSELVYKGLAEARAEGHTKESRNGGSIALRNAVFVLHDPLSRHLYLEGRKSNIFQIVAETMWVMAGADNVRGFLEFFLPRAPQYSDDGQRWHGAYGPRMYAFDQLEDAINLLQADPDTRRAIVMIADPGIDNLGAIQQRYGEGHTPKDIPCNRELHFNIYNNRLSLKVIQRSGDMLFGTGSINPFEFSFLLELVYETLKARGMHDLQLGEYIWDVTDAHYYTAFEDQVVATLAENDSEGLARRPRNRDVPLGTAFTSTEGIRSFFRAALSELDLLRGVLQRKAEEPAADPQDGMPALNASIDGAIVQMHVSGTISRLQSLMQQHNVNPEGQLANYLQATVAYIHQKCTGEQAERVIFQNVDHQSDYGRALAKSGFRKFPIGFIVKE